MVFATSRQVETERDMTIANHNRIAIEEALREANSRTADRDHGGVASGE
jgi:hypothetical protein